MASCSTGWPPPLPVSGFLRPATALRAESGSRYGTGGDNAE